MNLLITLTMNIYIYLCSNIVASQDNKVVRHCCWKVFPEFQEGLLNHSLREIYFFKM